MVRITISGRSVLRSLGKWWEARGIKRGQFRQQSPIRAEFEPGNHTNTKIKSSESKLPLRRGFLASLPPGRFGVFCHLYSFCSLFGVSSGKMGLCAQIFSDGRPLRFGIALILTNKSFLGHSKGRRIITYVNLHLFPTSRNIPSGLERQPLLMEHMRLPSLITTPPRFL
jgi:hypothetical protein